MPYCQKFTETDRKSFVYYINFSELRGFLLLENMISSHVKINLISSPVKISMTSYLQTSLPKFKIAEFNEPKFISI